jgi:hypothetical protein
MATRKEQERIDVARYMPANTKHVVTEGKDVWIFKKQTEVMIEFELAIYYDADEGGYCAQLVSPEIEDAWKDQHVGHLFRDGVICMGYESMRTRKTLKESYAKACLWSEGMGIMIFSHANGTPCEFPFSENNSADEARNALR